jgi:hypothetical protein
MADHRWLGCTAATMAAALFLPREGRRRALVAAPPE